MLSPNLDPKESPDQCAQFSLVLLFPILPGNAWVWIVIVPSSSIVLQRKELDLGSSATFAAEACIAKQLREKSTRLETPGRFFQIREKMALHPIPKLVTKSLGAWQWVDHGQLEGSA